MASNHSAAFKSRISNNSGFVVAMGNKNRFSLGPFQKSPPLSCHPVFHIQFQECDYLRCCGHICLQCWLVTHGSTALVLPCSPYLWPSTYWDRWESCRYRWYIRIWILSKRLSTECNIHITCRKDLWEAAIIILCLQMGISSRSFNTIALY